MDDCKCIVPVGHGGTLNIRRAASPLVKLVKEEERSKTPYHPPRCSSQLGGEGSSQIVMSRVWCSKLWRTTSEQLASSHEKVFGPRSKFPSIRKTVLLRNSILKEPYRSYADNERTFSYETHDDNNNYSNLKDIGDRPRHFELWSPESHTLSELSHQREDV
ncbi:hypothetical protein TNCV_4412681 [Trichonephila clavipes]|nr:hypothetical protein TNCV_4412681 [Trichonephila clavipes]